MSSTSARRRSPLDIEIQRLYGLPLSEFTATRNALAKRLRKEGDGDNAEEVASLPKPTASAWAVNHLFNVEPEGMEALLQSGDQARQALREILAGGDPGALRDAIEEARQRTDALRDRAVEILSAGGRRPGQAVVDRIAANLQSLAFSPAAEPAIERGWLDIDLPPPGFEVLAGLQLASLPKREHPARKLPPRPAPATQETPEAPAKTPRRGPKAREDKKREETQRRVERAREARERERRERREALQRERLERARAERDEAASRADFLRRKAEQAERAAEEIRERLEEAERLAEEAHRRQQEAERALAKADRSVQSAQRAGARR